METTTKAKPGRPKKTDFENAQALGQIKPLPEIATQPEVPAVEAIEYPDDPESFRMAVGHAQMEGADYLEVGPKVFHFLTKGHKTNYLTYGDPGIKVYLKGTKEDIDKLDNMSAESYHNHVLKNGIKG